MPADRLTQAQEALAVGDWERALVAFESAGELATDPEIQGSARLGMATVWLRSRQWEQAEVEFGRYLEAYPDHPRRADAFFFRARTYDQIGDFDRAAQDYLAYLELRPGRIDAYVRQSIGDSLRRAGRPMEAVPHYQAAIETPGISGALVPHIKLGHAYMEAADFSSALAQFDAVYQQTGDAATKASMNLLAGRSLEALGDPQAAYARYMDSVENFPSVYDSYNGLIRLVEAGVPVDEFQRGLVDYHAGAYTPALQAFNRLLAADEVPAAYYYRGLTRRALGDPASALLDFDYTIDHFPQDPHWIDAWLEKAATQSGYLGQASQAVDTYLGLVAALPEHRVAPQALFAAGRTAERADDLARAGEVWMRLALEYPEDELAFHGAFESGIARYRLEDYAAAEAAFEIAEARARDAGSRAGARLWMGKSRMSAGKAEAAREAWQGAAAIDPTGYYSVRAAHLLQGLAPFQSEGAVDFDADLEAERLEAEAWLRQQFSLSDAGPLNQLDAELAQDPRMIRGQELWRLGLLPEAKAEFEALRKAYEHDPEATYRLMHTFLELRVYGSAIFAARQVLRLAGMDDAATMQAPVYFNRVRFGAYYGELILPQAQEHGFDGLFLLSVVRQESLFEGFATSHASARGLMQIIPSTGQEVVGRLGWPPEYVDQDLYRPVVSVRLGAHYLAQQRQLFDGDLFAALAAYNGGPGNALGWKELAPNDPDLFLEVIRLAETHRYLTTIYEVYDIYRRLYVQPEPAQAD